MFGSSNARNLLVYFFTLLVTATPIVVFLAPSPDDEAGIAFALRMTAWLAFLVYVLIFMTRPLRQLFPNPLTRSLLEGRPKFGLIFAAIMTVHLALITNMFAFVLRETPPITPLLVGGAAYALIFLMLITTFDAPARALGPRKWRRLHKTGLYYIGAVFANTLIPDVLAKPSNPVYLTIGLLFIIAVTVRLTAFVKRKD